jgi:glycosyltransferase 2 family protein
MSAQCHFRRKTHPKDGGVKRTWWKAALKYGIGLALLVYVIWSHWEPKGEAGLGLKDVFRGGRDIDWSTYAIALGCLTATVALSFVRWYMLVRAQELPFALKDAFRLGLVGYFFNTFLPGSVGGDLLKAAFIAREHRRRTVAVSTVLIDRGIGLWGLIALVAVVGSVFWCADQSFFDHQPDLLRVLRAANGLMAATLVLWVFLGVLPERRAHRFAQRLLWIPKMGHVLAEFWRAVWLYRRRSLVVFTGLLMSMLGHVLNVFAFFFAATTFRPAAAVNYMPGLLEHFILVPAGITFQGFFPAPGGVGGGEFIFGFLYERLGFPGENGILGSLGQRILTWGLGLAGYMVYLFMKKGLPRAAPEVKSDKIN